MFCVKRLAFWLRKQARKAIGGAFDYDHTLMSRIKFFTYWAIEFRRIYGITNITSARIFMTPLIVKMAAIFVFTVMLMI